MERPGVLVFDVNETLLSLEPVRGQLERLFGSEPPLGEWFSRLLHGSLVADAIGSHRPFDEIGVEALLGLAARREVSMDRGIAETVVASMRSLPAHPDVTPALRRLARAGYRMVALTNGSAETGRAQIGASGLSGLLERVVSVDEVGRFKPHPDAYRHAASLSGVTLADLMMVAAHDWDCAGAMAVGARAVFVRRPGAVWSLPSSPEIEVPDLVSLADRLGA